MLSGSEGTIGKGEADIGQDRQQIEEMVFGLNEVVFAKCQNYKPWPGQIIKVSVGKLRNSTRDQYIYQVRFFGPTSYSDHCTAELEKFDQKTRTKYERLYHKTKDKEEKHILKYIQVALKRQQENEAILKATSEDPLLLTGLVPLPPLPHNHKSPNTYKGKNRANMETKSDTKATQNPSNKPAFGEMQGKMLDEVAKKTHPIFKRSSHRSKKKKQKQKDGLEKESSLEKSTLPGVIFQEKGNDPKIKQDLILGENQSKSGQLSPADQLYSKAELGQQQYRRQQPSLTINNSHDSPSIPQLHFEIQPEKKGAQEVTSTDLTFAQPVTIERQSQPNPTATLSTDCHPKETDMGQQEKAIKAEQTLIDQLISLAQEERRETMVDKPRAGITQEQQQEEVVDEETGQVIQLNIGYSDRIIGLESHVDELDIEDNNYLKLFKLFKTRKMMVEGRCPQELLSIANKYLQKMTKQVGKKDPTLLLSMKQKQVLMAILCCECVDIRWLLRSNTIIKMNQFILEYQQHDFPSKRHYEIQYEFMRGKVRLYLAALSRSLAVFRLGEQKEEEYKRMMRQFPKMH